MNTWIISENWNILDHEGDSNTNRCWIPWNCPELPRNDIGWSVDEKKREHLDPSPEKRRAQDIWWDL